MSQQKKLLHPRKITSTIYLCIILLPYTLSTAAFKDDGKSNKNVLKTSSHEHINTTISFLSTNLVSGTTPITNPVSRTLYSFNVVSTSNDVETTLKQRYILIGNASNTTSTTMQPNLSTTKAAEAGGQEPPIKFDLILFVIIMIFIPITIIGNLFVIIVIILSRNLRNQNTYIYLASLAVVDMLIGCISMPIKASLSWNEGKFMMSEYTCYFHLIVDVVFNVVSIFHLVVIALDRFLAIKIALQYTSKMTKGVVACVIFFVWFFAFCISALGSFNWHQRPEHPMMQALFYWPQSKLCVHFNNAYFTFLSVVVLLTPSAFLIGAYFYLYKVTVTQINAITKLNVQDSKGMKEKKRRRRQFRALRSCILVFVVYVLCWAPGLIFLPIIFYGADKPHWNHMNTYTWFQTIVFIILHVLPSLNSTTNPFIYVISNQTFRASCNVLIAKLTRNQLPQNYPLDITMSRSPSRMYTTGSILTMNSDFLPTPTPIRKSLVPRIVLDGENNTKEEIF